MQDLNGKRPDTPAASEAMPPFERRALAHIAQELLWDPGLIPLASFSAVERRRILLMLRRLAGHGPAPARHRAA
jgi:hypothetical protein